MLNSLYREGTEINNPVIIKQLFKDALIETLQEQHELLQIILTKALKDIVLSGMVKESQAIEADNARWDALLETDAAQAALEQLADEALLEHRAAKTKPLTFSHNGKIIPE